MAADWKSPRSGAGIVKMRPSVTGYKLFERQTRRFPRFRVKKDTCPASQLAYEAGVGWLVGGYRTLLRTQYYKRSAARIGNLEKLDTV